MSLHMVTRSVSSNVLRHGVVSLCYDELQFVYGQWPSIALLLSEGFQPREQLCRRVACDVVLSIDRKCGNSVETASVEAQQRH